MWKWYLVKGYYTVNEKRVDTNIEIGAPSIAAAIEKYNNYNTKIYGADTSSVIMVFECVWN